MARIILAEDDESMARLLTTLLNMEGFDVTTLTSGAEVAATVQRDRPDLLILDFLLADQSGLDVLDAVRRAEGQGRVRVVMISGLNVRDECLRHGADEFLLKPFMPDELIALLKTPSESA